MADYVRRQIAPLLPGLDAKYLELIVGELEIATETRHCVRATDDDDVAAAVLDILEAAGYAANRAAAKVYCERILLQLHGTEGSSVCLFAERELAAADRGASEMTTSTDAKSRAHAVATGTNPASENWHRPRCLPEPEATICTTAFVSAAVAVAVALAVLSGSSTAVSRGQSQEAGAFPCNILA